MSRVSRPKWLDQEAAEPWDEQSEHLAQYALQLEDDHRFAQRCLHNASRMVIWLMERHPETARSAPQSLREAIEQDMRDLDARLQSEARPGSPGKGE